MSKSKNKIPTKKQLLSLLKKYNYVKQHAADTQGVDEKTVRRWCKHHGIDVDFERKKYILEYEFTNVLPKDVAKKSPLNDDNTRVLPGSDTEENRRNFVFSDLQIPYHNRKALSIAVSRCKDYLDSCSFKGETYCTIIGDFMDNKPLMGKDKQRRPTLQTDELKELDLEFIEAAKILEEIEKVLPKGCVKVFLKGNHEDRADKIIEKPDGIYWKRHLDIDDRLGLTARGWKVFKYNESWKLGHLHYTHGAFFGKHHAWQHAQHWCKNVMYGHTHQIQVFTMSSPVRELPVWSGSIGCLADVSPEWHRNKPNSHEHAFAEVSYIGEDFFPVIHRIIKGKLVVNGKVYKA